MREYLYRYIGFDSFVDMIQTQSLTFVLPHLWEDTYEMKAFYPYVRKKDNFNQIIALKRAAFSHEKEVRLIWRYKFRDNDDAERHIRSVIGLTFPDLPTDSEEKDTVRQIIDSFEPSNPKKAVEEIVKITNANAAVKTKKISFAGINNFIQGVEVHPLVPKWFVQTVEQYCIEHKVFFEGKSQLYT